MDRALISAGIRGMRGIESGSADGGGMLCHSVRAGHDQTAVGGRLEFTVIIRWDAGFAVGVPWQIRKTSNPNGQTITPYVTGMPLPEYRLPVYRPEMAPAIPVTAGCTIHYKWGLRRGRRTLASR